MRFFPRRAAASLTVLALLLSGAPAPLAARTESAPAATSGALAPKVRPWLYENSDVPIDAAWRFGTLSNGLRYAIRRNGVPPGQVSVRLRIDAGSLMERPDEQGYAHFMEHLTFRGSRHVPDGESKRIWQRLGVTFGSDSNAQTTPTGTSYALDLPQATPQSLGESLKILAGMMADPNIVDSAVDAERAVVLAERRESDGPQTRISDVSREHFFAGQPMADRAPIGTVATLNAATAAKMTAFHERWYRPENAVIAIAGDIDPALAEQLIKDQFGGWSVPGKGAPMPDFGAPDPKFPATRVAVEPGVPLGLTLAWLRPWKPRADTILYNQDKLTDMLALQIISRRLEQAARSGGSFLQSSVEQQDVSRSVDGTFMTIIPVGENWQKALADVRGIVEDAKTTPPSQTEIDREYAQMDTALAIQVENADTEAGAKQASDLISAVDIRETTVSPDAALSIFRSGKANMTPAKIVESTNRLFSAGVFRALLVTGTAQPGLDAKLAAAVAAPVKAATNARLADKIVTMADLPKLGAPATVVSRRPIGLAGMESITFSNGVKLTLFANDAETEKVRINVRFGHGQQAFSPVKPVASWAGDYALVASGIGTLGQRELDDLTNGRRMGMDFSIDEDAFELQAVTRPADYKDQLRLFATKLGAPGWDPAPIARVKAGATVAYDAMTRSPDAVLGRDLGWLLHDKDVRFRTPSLAEINALTPQAFRATWEPILASGPIEVQIFGQVKPDDAIAAVAQTLGALPPRADTPVPAANLAMRFPAHVETPIVLRHKGDKEQAAAVMAWPTSGGFTLQKEARQLEILTQIFNDRLFDRLRSTEGAAYSPSVQNSWPFSYESGGYILVTSQVRPDRIAYFYDVVKSTAADLARTPVSEDELQRAVAPMRQMLMRAGTGNAFWMNQMEGATHDARYVAAMQTMAQDMLTVTPAQLQALAARYLVPAKSWSAIVLPEGVEAK
ncbi:MAG: insulinase family protein [Sphingobium sp.]|uniref:M16 family metallopeptidase n=1 Tax=Sphingobium sp. TaxID=1912891 RepID=UPI000C5B686C|nr:M16 family metallopeptidase [Sphingobium sp.]MBU0659945.1 insulinase family protein [Alphaproteobacteria bacterium]MBA4754889.1 insulinase family protein [Sphingobium sp.]MBS87225.1 peptidase M16 [Sphingobium sp.]MBU1794754.1 insulinase family protein [Alphaproteobacteria bacterium]MBU2015662.1 insulinase family protein [Alphaproteobacteria bacterium]